MNFNVNDKVIFLNSSSYVNEIYTNTGFTKDKEYTIIEKRVDSQGRIFFVIINDNGNNEYVYQRNVIISKAYQRNKIINNILK